MDWFIKPPSLRDANIVQEVNFEKMRRASSAWDKKEVNLRITINGVELHDGPKTIYVDPQSQKQD